MRPLQELRRLLTSLAREVEVLPAVGGAVEDLERPDAEEREDQAVNREEKIFQTLFEREASGSRPRLYRPVPPLGRAERRLFRYFLDGSFRSYFLGTVLENDRESPVHYAQIGACVLRREADGSVRKEALQLRHLVLAGKQRLSEAVWTNLETLARRSDLTLVDLTERDLVNGEPSDVDLRSRAAGKVRFALRELEAKMLATLSPQLAEDRRLIVDGSLLFEPILTHLSQHSQAPWVVGVSKNFRKDPQFVFGRDPRAERRSIYKLLADLQAEHRTAAFSAQEGKVVFWYVRLREQTYLDYPLMGVIKVELVNPLREPVPSEVIDEISGALVAERCVTPHGRDRRWHAHLYPIYLAETAVKESLFSREVVQQFVKWR